LKQNIEGARSTSRLNWQDAGEINTKEDNQYLGSSKKELANFGVNKKTSSNQLDDASIE